MVTGLARQEERCVGGKKRRAGQREAEPSGPSRGGGGSQLSIHLAWYGTEAGSTDRAEVDGGSPQPLVVPHCASHSPQKKGPQVGTLLKHQLRQPVALLRTWLPVSHS